MVKTILIFHKKTSSKIFKDIYDVFSNKLLISYE